MLNIQRGSNIVGLGQTPHIMRGVSHYARRLFRHTILVPQQAKFLIVYRLYVNFISIKIQDAISFYVRHQQFFTRNIS